MSLAPEMRVSDRDRPTAFESSPAVPTTLYIFKRVRPKD